MIEYTIFIVDDEKSIREGIGCDLEEEYSVFEYSTAEDALKDIKTNRPDLILLDIGLPGMSGIEALKEFRKIDPEILVIMITAFEDVDAVVASMKGGAYDYVVKPIHMDVLEITIGNCLERIRLKKELQNLQEKQIAENVPFFIGESNIIYEILDYIGMVAKSEDTPILILGDTGTGKELIASNIHYRSPNYKGPFITLNCAAIPKDLLESELFGYEKGAFSGASLSGKRGFIEEAEGGTLFLDEVGDLSLDAQAKLLRFLDDGEYYKVGSTTKQKVRTRIVSATNKDLNYMISKETFRKDLYFRLGVIKIEVPSLNDRQEDVLLLAEYFLNLFNIKFQKKIYKIEEEALELLKLYTWSGNVRELKNMMERAVLIARGDTLTSLELGLNEIKMGVPMPQMDVSPFPPIPPTGIDLDQLREVMDSFYFKQAMEMANGNETRAAKLLNLKHHTFRYQFKKLMERTGE
jgi:DNA-binding NtrC family response regulator